MQINCYEDAEEWDSLKEQGTYLNPVSTIPRDGRRFLAYFEHEEYPIIIWYNTETGCFTRDGYSISGARIIGWLPLPRAIITK